MKIAIIPGGNFKYNKGGSELQCQQLGEFLSETGHKVFFINTIERNMKNIPKVESEKTYHMYNVRKIPILKINILKYLKYLSKEKPDLIYCRILKWNIFVIILSKIINAPVVFNISSDQIVKKIDYSNSYFFSCIIYIKNKLSLKYSDLIISQTQFQKEQLKKNFNLDSIIINNGLKVPNPPFKKVYPPLITWIGNIKKIKRPEIFIDLAERLKKFNVSLIYAGRMSNDEIYQNSLIRKTDKISSIKYLGEISFRETNELISKASILVNTSVVEGFSNTFIQAWMRETPVISLQCDPDNIIRDNGFGFKCKNFDEMVKNTKFLIMNEKEREKMGKKARNYAVSKYNIKETGIKYVKIFKRLIK